MTGGLEILLEWESDGRFSITHMHRFSAHLFWLHLCFFADNALVLASSVDDIRWKDSQLSVKQL